MKCPHCLKEMPDERSSCPSCGTAVGDSVTPTRLFAEDENGSKLKGAATIQKASSQSTRTTSSFDSIDDARFAPGTTLAGRYRIVSLLGRGGMGEVYRADDLKLGQPVALKFLPEALSKDGAALARFHREVRVARQVSHRNVCRVYDIGEIEGQNFLSMEFIKGEELASLLRRIGRLPSDKAVEIARQLCAGLAAAHDNDVLHRDLKPANIMIDADGDVRITDFGLAGLAEEIRSDEVRAGTPAYMAPEQLSGEEVSIKSDIYSLGLVLYEIFTGKRAFEARTVDELLRLRKSDTTPTTPSDLVKEIDPLVERVILRCLEKDPKARPSSALQVAAALPGGDPLQAALAAGETPSPEMVAAAAKEGALRPMIAVSLVVSFFVLYALACFFADSFSLYSIAPLNKSPEVLRDRARDVAAKLGYTNAPTDSADGINPYVTYLQYIADNDRSPRRWDKIPTGEPPAYLFWYRQSPRYLVKENTDPITLSDPPENISGMVTVELDTQGQLRFFSAVPPQREEAGAVAQQQPLVPDWQMLLNEAGFSQANFHQVESTWIPRHAYDLRAAWDGPSPAQPDINLHIEAASFRGKPVYFEVIYPWDRPALQEEVRESTSTHLLYLMLIIIIMVTLVISALLAFRNLRLGRGDRKGAFRVALFIFTVRMMVYLFDVHHVWTREEFDLFTVHVMFSLFFAFFIWLIYIALEPFVRRRWPDGIIGWTRLLAGGFRDPLVGRDILIGSVVGTGMILSNAMVGLVPRWLGLPAGPPHFDAQRMMGVRNLVSELSSDLSSAFLFSFVMLFLLVLLLMLLRRKWLAGLAVWLIVSTALFLAFNDAPLAGGVFAFSSSFLVIGALYRYGVLAQLTAMFIFHTWIFLPITLKLSAWWAADFVPALILCAALVIYAFLTSLAGQKLFRGRLLED